MKVETWEQINKLFHAALEREPDERAAFVAQACDGDDTLRKEVESLVASHEQANSFIESPAGDLAAELFAPSHDNAVGRTVGPYRILDLLGTGGMGEVYLAEDARLGRRVALKLLPAQFTEDKDRLRRFEREARAASALNHPNILVIYDTGKDSGSHFIATEFVEGETLRRRLTHSRMSLGEVVDIAVQATSALAAAHQAGIVHRDIKPENIMLRPDGYIKLLDFGLAKLTESQTARDTEGKTKTGQVMGTVTYMSPEQARGLAVDARSDLFSLGTVIYEMITGRVPFDGETTSDVIVSLLEKEPPPLTELAPDVPDELERISKKLLVKDREERYQAAKDLLIDLTNLKQDLQVRTRMGAESQGGPRQIMSAMTERIQLSVDTGGKPAIQTAEVGSTRTLSGIESLWVNRTAKWKLGLSAFVLLIVAATLVFFLILNKPKLPVTDSSMKTIAVLPFKPLAAENRNESLELGMADTLINKLSGLSQLIVRPVSEVRKYRKLDQDSIAAGRELGVDYVLEGNLQVLGEKTRTTVRLLSVKDGGAVWTDKCDEQCSNLFEFQDAIAERIAGVLALGLTSEERKQLAKHYTDNPEAYQLYSLGESLDLLDTKRRLEYYEQAVRLDPKYALAYRGIFGSIFYRGTRGFYISKEERQKSEWAALKAVEIDDSLAEAHAALAETKKYNFDWAGADKEFKRALELDPDSFFASGSYSSFLIDMRRWDEALAYARRAEELAKNVVPGHKINRAGGLPRAEGYQAYVYLHKREFATAIELYLKQKERYPNSDRGNFQLGEAYVGNGMYVEAIAELGKVIAFDDAPERWDRYPHPARPLRKRLPEQSPVF